MGTVSLTRVNFRRRLFFWRRGSFGDTPLRRLMRRGPPHANPDEPIEDALSRMAENSLTIIPVMTATTGQFLHGLQQRDPGAGRPYGRDKGGGARMAADPAD